MRYCPPKRDVSTLEKGDFTTLCLHAYKVTFTTLRLHATMLYLLKSYTCQNLILVKILYCDKMHSNILLSTIRRISS